MRDHFKTQKTSDPLEPANAMSVHLCNTSHCAVTKGGKSKVAAKLSVTNI